MWNWKDCYNFASGEVESSLPGAAEAKEAG